MGISTSTDNCPDVCYTVTNSTEKSPGGVRFASDIGFERSKQILDEATKFIWNTFQRNNPCDRIPINRVGLFIDDIDGVSYTSISNNEIHLSVRHIDKFSGDVKNEIKGVLYYEMTRVWQWNGNGQAPSGLIDGVADFVRLKACGAPSHWVEPGGGDRWDQGYAVTARFLDYCDGLRSGTFVAELNKKMRDGYTESFFQDLLGKSVGSLWKDYKARYNN